MHTAFHEILKDAAQPTWEAILAHPYLKELGAGRCHDRFLYFIRQDYLYLFEFKLRVLCVGGSKAEDLETLECSPSMQPTRPSSA
jgi:thiaminase/transcriptional activator TenA